MYYIAPVLFYMHIDINSLLTNPREHYDKENEEKYRRKRKKQRGTGNPD